MADSERDAAPTDPTSPETGSQAVQMAEVQITPAAAVLNRQGTTNQMNLSSIKRSFDKDGVDEHGQAILDILHESDVNQDGKLSQNEVNVAMRKIVKIEGKRSTLKKMVGLLLSVVLFTMLGNMALTAAIVFLAKDSYVKSSQAGPVMTDADGKTMLVGSVDMTVGESHQLLDRNGVTVQVAATSVELKLDSRLPDFVLDELKYIDFRSPSGSRVHLFVLAYSRVMSSDALFGSYLRIHSAIGDIYLDGNIVTFHDGMQGMFTQAGFTVQPGHRRLQSAFDLIGLFNAIPEFESWNSTYDVPPQIPMTFVADIKQLHACIYEAQDAEPVDLCDSFDVPQKHIITHRGERWVQTNMTLFSDAAKKLVRESFHGLPLFPHWQVDRIKNMDAKTAHSAQMWTPSKERYFCRSSEGVQDISFGALGSKVSDFMGVYDGNVDLDNETLHKFTIKHRTNENTKVEYYTTIDAELTTDEAIAIIPREIVMTIHPKPPTDQAPGSAPLAKGRRIAFQFESFDVTDEVADSSFHWGLDGGLGDSVFNETVCASTLAYTEGTVNENGGEEAGVVPHEAAIRGSSPFVPQADAADNSMFFWILQYYWAQGVNMTVEQYNRTFVHGLNGLNETQVRISAEENLANLDDDDDDGSNSDAEGMSPEMEAELEAFLVASSYDEATKQSLRESVANYTNATTVREDESLKDYKPRIPRAFISPTHPQFARIVVLSDVFLYMEAHKREVTAVDEDGYDPNDHYPNEFGRRQLLESGSDPERPQNVDGDDFTKLFPSSRRKLGHLCSACTESAAKEYGKSCCEYCDWQNCGGNCKKDYCPPSPPPNSYQGGGLLGSLFNSAASGCTCPTCPGNCQDTCGLVYSWPAPLIAMCEASMSVPHECARELSCEGLGERQLSQKPPVKVSAGGSMSYDCPPPSSPAPCFYEGCMWGTVAVGFQKVDLDAISASFYGCIGGGPIGCTEYDKYTLGPLKDARSMWPWKYTQLPYNKLLVMMESYKDKCSNTASLINAIKSQGTNGVLRLTQIQRKCEADYKVTQDNFRTFMVQEDPKYAGFQPYYGEECAIGKDFQGDECELNNLKWEKVKNKDVTWTHGEVYGTLIECITWCKANKGPTDWRVRGDGSMVGCHGFVRASSGTSVQWCKWFRKPEIVTRALTAKNLEHLCMNWNPMFAAICGAQFGDLQTFNAYLDYHRRWDPRLKSGNAALSYRDHSSHILYRFKAAKIYIPEYATANEGSMRQHNFGQMTTRMGLKVGLAGGVVGADISMTTYAFTGKAGSTEGPDHSAQFWLGTEYQGTFSWPACRSDRRNWFAGSKRNYAFTVQGYVEVCFIVCADIINGYIKPWGEK